MKQFIVEYVDSAKGRMKKVLESYGWPGVVADINGKGISSVDILSIVAIPEEEQDN